MSWTPGASPRFATCGADDLGGVNAVVLVGSETLLFLWRGYADPAPRAPSGAAASIPREVSGPRTPAPSLSPNSRPPMALETEAGQERPRVRAQGDGAK